MRSSPELGRGHRGSRSHKGNTVLATLTPSAAYSGPRRRKGFLAQGCNRRTRARKACARPNGSLNLSSSQGAVPTNAPKTMGVPHTPLCTQKCNELVKPHLPTWRKQSAVTSIEAARSHGAVCQHLYSSRTLETTLTSGLSLGPHKSPV